MEGKTHGLIKIEPCGTENDPLKRYVVVGTLNAKINRRSMWKNTEIDPDFDTQNDIQEDVFNPKFRALELAHSAEDALAQVKSWALSTVHTFFKHVDVITVQSSEDTSSLPHRVLFDAKTGTELARMPMKRKFKIKYRVKYKTYEWDELTEKRINKSDWITEEIDLNPNHIEEIVDILEKKTGKEILIGPVNEIGTQSRFEQLEKENFELRCLLKEIYDWTRYKHTEWAKKVKRVLES